MCTPNTDCTGFSSSLSVLSDLWYRLHPHISGKPELAHTNQELMDLTTIFLFVYVALSDFVGRKVAIIIGATVFTLGGAVQTGAFFLWLVLEHA